MEDGKLLAKRKVRWPAIGLLVLSAINVLFAGFIAIAGFSNSKAFNLGPQEGVIGVFMLISAGCTILGTIKFMALRSYGLAMTAAILAMVPCCSPCLLVGLPMGIWALVTLSDPTVKAAFKAP